MPGRSRRERTSNRTEIQAFSQCRRLGRPIGRFYVATLMTDHQPLILRLIGDKLRIGEGIGTILAVLRGVSREGEGWSLQREKGCAPACLGPDTRIRKSRYSQEKRIHASSRPATRRDSPLRSDQLDGICAFFQEQNPKRPTTGHGSH